MNRPDLTWNNQIRGAAAAVERLESILSLAIAAAEALPHGLEEEFPLPPGSVALIHAAVIEAEAIQAWCLELQSLAANGTPLPYA